MASHEHPLRREAGFTTTAYRYDDTTHPLRDYLAMVAARKSKT